jgi:RNA polymerase sigma-70 factor, ECF subfamily
VREPTGDDAELLGRLRAGDGRAFETLVTTYQHRVFGVALRMLGSRAEAEDVAQETFLRAHRALADFRGESRLGTWLYAIASRLCLNRLASGAHRLERGDEAALLRLAAPGGDTAAALERSELEAALQQAIAALPEERRIVLVLRDLEGLAYEEIAQALGLELGTVLATAGARRCRMAERETSNPSFDKEKAEGSRESVEQALDDQQGQQQGATRACWHDAGGAWTKTDQ